MIKTVSEFIIAIFTVALFIATLVLAKHTKKLDEHEMEQRRIQNLQRCIFLAESIVGMLPADFSRKSINSFSELLTLSKYFHDSDTKRQFEHVVNQLQSVLLEHEIGVFDKNLIDPFNKIRPRLTQEIIEWQKDLGNYGGR